MPMETKIEPALGRIDAMTATISQLRRELAELGLYLGASDKAAGIAYDALYLGLPVYERTLINLRAVITERAGTTATRRDELVTQALGIEPGETKRVELSDELKKELG